MALQLKNAEKSVQSAKKEVLELEQVLDCAIKDLASDNPDFSIKEVEVLKGLFNEEDLDMKDTKLCLKIAKVRISKLQKDQGSIARYPQNLVFIRYFVGQIFT